MLGAMAHKWQKPAKVRAFCFTTRLDDVQEPQNDHEPQRHAEQPKDDWHFGLLSVSVQA
jgi:hypothetical protein